MHVQSPQNYCFSLLNMQVWEIVIVVVVVPAQAPYQYPYLSLVHRGNTALHSNNVKANFI